MIRSFNGKTPRVADSAFVSEAAYVIGDVEIGDGSGIFPGAVIRADFGSIKIGRNTMVEDNSVIHSGGSVEIATLLDNAEIGSFCIIGAGCLVNQGMVIPDNSFVVGIPAEIKGQVAPERWEQRRSGRGGYSELVKMYKEQGL